MTEAIAQPELRVERLSDPAGVRSVLSEVWPHIRDDASPEECPESIVIGPGDVYVGIWDDAELVGAYYFRPVTAFTWEGHINVKPSAWGGCDDYTHAAIRWMLDNTTCEKVIGYIPVTCDAVLRHVARCGFKSHAVIKGGTCIGGEPVDLVMVEY